MDADKLRSLAAQIRRDLVDGRPVALEHVRIEPASEGCGFLFHARGQTWHRTNPDAVVQALFQELGRSA